MQKLYLFFLFLTLCLCSCKKDALTSDYNTSYSKFLAFKRSASKGYTYTAITSSFFSFETETKITVINGLITARDFVSYRYITDAVNNTQKKEIVNQWHEASNELNSHTGAWFLTLDEVYKKAKTEWLTADPKKNTIYFESKNDGMISEAGYVPIGCQDDCFWGIHISVIAAL